MRDGYIKVIKEYIVHKIQRNYTLDQIKKDVIQAGATAEEFNESLNQLTNSNISASASKPQEKTKTLGFLKNRKLIFAFSFVFILFFGFIIINQIINSRTNTTLVTSIPKNPSHPKSRNQDPIAQVFANMEPIDPAKAFSYPKSNIPLVITAKPKKEVLGFFPYWMLPKAQDINLGILTSVSLFGLEVDGKGNIVTTSSTSEADGGWQMWKDLRLDKFISKARSNGLKIYLTLKAFNSNNINSLVNSDAAQKEFISTALYLVSSKNLNGINIDFEYSGTPTTETSKGFTRLITNLSAELKRQFPKALLTIDTYVISGSVPGLFELELLSKHVDAFVIMGYDFHTATGAPGPISPVGGDINIIGLVQGYLEKVPAQKIILAVPYYGYDWPVSVESSDSLGKAAILPYSEIAQASIKHNLLWDDVSQTPWYTYTANKIKREVHFDSVRSLGIKYDYVNSKNLKGVGIWALGYDGLNSDLQRLILDKFSN